MLSCELIDVPDGLLVGYLEADNVRATPSPEPLLTQISERVEGVRTGAEGPSDAVRAAVRNLLRTPAYKPTGRGKPASEYLVKVAKEGDFPRINALVDINNLASLETGWPWSVLDRTLASPSGGGFEVRRGYAGESYVFNATGQTIELHGLLLAARAGAQALANPVKDAMLAKTTSDTTEIVAFAYAHEDVATREDVQRHLDAFAERLRTFAGASDVRTIVRGQRR